jgi:uncharacterized membrane protein YraQ (UPF0718 family)
METFLFTPFEAFAKFITFSVFQITEGSHLAHTLEFFIYDTGKIIFLMIAMMHIMGVVHYYFPLQKLKLFLTRKKLFGLEYLFATLFGAITPFCSCSSLPLFIGFIKSGIPVGVTFSFLITSPLINEISLALFFGIFGWKITLIYALSGIIIGIFGGIAIQALKMEKYIEPFVLNQNLSENDSLEANKPPLREVFPHISKEAFLLTKTLLPYLVLGIGIGAIIHGYVPEGFFEQYLQSAGVFGVPLAVILGVPLYSNATGVIPIVQSLTAKGVPLGTALAFMMAIIGLSFPAGVILKKVLKWQLLATFFGIVTGGIILIGYVMNLFL